MLPALDIYNFLLLSVDVLWLLLPKQLLCNVMSTGSIKYVTTVQHSFKLIIYISKYIIMYVV